MSSIVLLYGAAEESVSRIFETYRGLLVDIVLDVGSTHKSAFLRPGFAVGRDV